jgi:cell filamentation protein
VSEPPRRYEWEDYLYPPAALTGEQVLRNRLDLRDPAQLHDAERLLTAGRARELEGNRDLVPRTFDAAHWRGIHRHLFQDVYEWAGQWRTVDISKGGSSFIPAEGIEEYAG